MRSTETFIGSGDGFAGEGFGNFVDATALGSPSEGWNDLASEGAGLIAPEGDGYIATATETVAKPEGYGLGILLS